MNNVFPILTAVGLQCPTAFPPVVRRILLDQKYWQEQGWQYRGDVMTGYYRTFMGSFDGYIKLYDSGDHYYYIYRPPRQLAQHPHAPCFIYQGNSGWHWVHFNLKPKNVDAGIVTIETILREALERYV